MIAKNMDLLLKYKNHDININLLNVNWQDFQNYPNNIQHHIFSLRWITSYTDEIQINIAYQFCKNFNKIDNSTEYLFYLGKYADHTASIRINILLKILKNYLDEDVSHVLSMELFKTFKSIYDGKTYSPGSNHAIMCDLALLNCSDLPP